MQCTVNISTMAGMHHSAPDGTHTGTRGRYWWWLWQRHLRTFKRLCMVSTVWASQFCGCIDLCSYTQLWKWYQCFDKFLVSACTSMYRQQANQASMSENSQVKSKIQFPQQRRKMVWVQSPPGTSAGYPKYCKVHVDSCRPSQWPRHFDIFADFRALKEFWIDHIMPFKLISYISCVV